MLSAEHHAMLYGPADTSGPVHTRMLNDLHAPIVALVNVYGDMCRPPQDTLTWPASEIKPLRPVLNAMAEQLGRAESVQGTGDYYRALAGAIGYYDDALRMLARLGRATDHGPVELYARAARRAMKGCTSPRQYEAAAAGEQTDLPDTLLRCCRLTRKRFGDQLREHTVTFDPPAVAAQYTYQPHEGSEAP